MAEGLETSLSFARVVLGWDDAYHDHRPAEYIIHTHHRDRRWSSDFSYLDVGSVMAAVQYFCEMYTLTMEIKYSGCKREYRVRMKDRRPHARFSEWAVSGDVCGALMTAALLAVGNMREKRWE
jgi:hypothetical protein